MNAVVLRILDQLATPIPMLNPLSRHFTRIMPVATDLLDSSATHADTGNAGAGVSRRALLGRGLGLGLGAGLAAGFGGGLVLPASAGLIRLSRQELADRRKLWAQTTPKRAAKNIIFMVSDGMSLGTLTLSDLVLRRMGDRRSAWLALNSQPGVHRAMQRTGCLDSLVTDSAAAATTWGGGEKVPMGSVNVTAEGRQLFPVLIQAQQAGKATGCVTTTRITHATPAGFYANSPRRDHEGLIAKDLVSRNIDVALGGGARFFPAELLSKQPGLKVVRTLAELSAEATTPTSARLLGLWSDSHVPFVSDRAPTCPSLLDMTNVALTRLAAKPDGFVLQIEAGRVDHAAHDNDAAALVNEQIEFDDCIAHVVNWLKDRDDTLLIITTDHGNANPGLTAYRDEATSGLDRLRKATKSFEWLSEKLEPMKLADDRRPVLAGLIEEGLSVKIDDVERDMLIDVMNGKRVSPYLEQNKWPSVLGGILAQHFGVAFMSPNHTADLTEVTACGPGSELLPPVIENTDLHGMMIAAMSLPAGKLLPDMESIMDMKQRPKPD